MIAGLVAILVVVAHLPVAIFMPLFGAGNPALILSMQTFAMIGALRSAPASLRDFLTDHRDANFLLQVAPAEAPNGCVHFSPAPPISGPAMRPGPSRAPPRHALMR